MADLEVSPTPRRSERAGARESRWNRAPAPHDWRWAVGHVGRALITVGLLMIGFAGYQLWGTGLQTARAQDDLGGRWNALLAANGITPDTLAPTSVTAATTTTSPVLTTTTSTSSPSTVSTVEAVSTTLPTPAAQDYGAIAPGDVLATLIIPKIQLDWKVVAGVGAKELAKGPGHFPDTPLPGQFGNSAIAGHRTGYGGPFMDLDLLVPGDEIQVYTRIGGAFSYIVTDSVIVEPTDYAVISDSDPSVATLVLVTCTPKYTSLRRLVVRATLDSARSSAIGAPLIFYGQDAPATVEGVLPTDVPTTSEAAPTTATATTTTSATAAAGTTAATTTATTTSPAASASTIGRPPNAFGSVDAFGQGWFDDTWAWPHVAGWASVLALIALGAHHLARRWRRLLPAWLVAVVPFLVVLYFFYENVNRLLPAAI